MVMKTIVDKPKKPKDKRKRNNIFDEGLRRFGARNNKKTTTKKVRKR